MRLRFDPPTDPGAYPFVHSLRVRFYDTDAMAVVHHATYLRYLEEARTEYLRAVGHPYREVQDEGFDFPVVEVALRYLRPLRFDDLVEVSVMVSSVTAATFQLAYLVCAGGEPRASAVTVHAAVNRAGRAARPPVWLKELVTGTGGPASR